MSGKPDLSLEVDDLATDPMVQFRRWFEDAEAESIHLANAIALATATTDARPTVRHVLLRGFDERGFSFYTNYESRKARQLADNPRVATRIAVCLSNRAGIAGHWPALVKRGAPMVSAPRLLERDEV